jgi:hypothetical protein
VLAIGSLQADALRIIARVPVPHALSTLTPDEERPMFMVILMLRAEDVKTGEMTRSRMRTEMLPMLAGLPGFIDYRSMPTSEDHLVIVHTWHTREQGMEGLRQMGEWGLQFVPSVMRLERVFTGEVIASSDQALP